MLKAFYCLVTILQSCLTLEGNLKLRNKSLSQHIEEMEMQSNMFIYNYVTLGFKNQQGCKLTEAWRDT